MQNNKATTIRMEINTKKRLDTYKLLKEETHNNLLTRLLDEIDTWRKTPRKNKKLIM